MGSDPEPSVCKQPWTSNPSIFSNPSLPTQTACVCFRSEVGMDTHDNSCIKQHHLFLRLVAVERKTLQMTQYWFYIFIGSLALITHCNCTTVTQTGFSVFAEGWEMMEKWSKLNFFCMPDCLIWPSLDDLNKYQSSSCSWGLWVELTAHEMSPPSDFQMFVEKTGSNELGQGWKSCCLRPLEPFEKIHCTWYWAIPLNLTDSHTLSPFTPLIIRKGAPSEKINNRCKQVLQSFSLVKKMSK